MTRYILEDPTVAKVEIELIATKFPEKFGTKAGAEGGRDNNYGLGQSKAAAAIAKELR